MGSSHALAYIPLFYPLPFGGHSLHFVNISHRQKNLVRKILQGETKAVPLQQQTEDKTMLGIKTRRAPIGGDIAKEIRDAVVRVTTGQLNEEDLESVRRSKEALSRYQVRWEI